MKEFDETYRKANPDLRKKKEYRDEKELWLKVKKDQEQYETTFTELKGTAVKFHKLNITFWVKAISQPKNKQKAAPATQSMDITN